MLTFFLINLLCLLKRKEMSISTLNMFISKIMKTKNDFTHIESDNIKKIYNKDFEILIYKLGKHPQTLIIDKRGIGNPIIYNNIDIASHHILKFMP